MDDVDPKAHLHQLDREMRRRAYAIGSDRDLSRPGLGLGGGLSDPYRWCLGGDEPFVRAGTGRIVGLDASLIPTSEPFGT